MLFSSFVFISLFLPSTLAIYYVVPRHARNLVLLVASILFYAWGDFNFLLIMLAVIGVNFVGAILVEMIPCGQKVVRKLIVSLFICANISVLVYFKYFDFIMVNISQLGDFTYVLRNIVMPLGISFYTFQGLSYLVDVYRGEIAAQRNFLNLALFISFFPQLVAGPILKYHDVCLEIENRRETFAHFTYGLQRFIMGLSRKVVIANSMGFVADRIFGQPMGSFDVVTAWGGAGAYSLQLYFDFSGYSDMAIGLGAMFGFHFKENFDYPYVAKSITEFWRRWHISLSTWFKEYLYIPLGGNRVAKSRNLLNLFIVFLATGIWHGAAWSFVIWGLIHGFFIILEKLTGFNKVEGGRWRIAAHRVYLLLVVVFAWVVFRADDLSYACGYWGSMLGIVDAHPIYTWRYYFSNFSLFMMLIAIALSLGVFRRVQEWGNCSKYCQVVFNAWLIVLFVICLVFLAGATYNPFIYFRF